ncbi:hypothetical protein AUQ37_04125 [Candidatus Methanomethylophilus sp. 1R26]|uniref:metalloregulator ArsR/SmtB family transcription factor n=1 Tax=Candidatus Methanomethylophilus sp. 1R26 TaxID=1769296 RepID=UPI00073CEBAF|nr:metalloregulator ArsR/SmtB family transcription factor [Candidatus Methanomethylophilus sp. 1R26]KUE73054.1 hypothetical protein AUQ37_04125 [Candidatus Methanomethylophilus sp. 1R26]
MSISADSDGGEQLTDNERAIIQYWDSHAHAYGMIAQIRMNMPNKLKQIFEQIAPGNRSLRVADMGSGIGYSAVTLAEMGHDVTAVDLGRRITDEAENIAESKGVKIRFVISNLYHTGLKKGSFDIVSAVDTLCLLDDPGKAVTEWVSLLRPGGRLVIVDGNYFITKIEEYNKRRAYFKMKYGKSEHERDLGNGSIDYPALEGLCRDLYASRVRRPGWELWFLQGLGMNEIEIETLDEETFYDISKNGKMLFPVKYALSARKPFFSENSVLNDTDSDVDLIKKMTTDSNNDDVAAVMSALSKKERVKIIRCLEMSSLTVSELMLITGLRENLLSYHLKVLKEANLVESEKNGREITYMLTDRKSAASILNIAETMR